MNSYKSARDELIASGTPPLKAEQLARTPAWHRRRVAALTAAGCDPRRRATRPKPADKQRVADLMSQYKGALDAKVAQGVPPATAHQRVRQELGSEWFDDLRAAANGEASPVHSTPKPKATATAAPTRPMPSPHMVAMAAQREQYYNSKYSGDDDLTDHYMIPDAWLRVIY